MVTDRYAVIIAPSALRDLKKLDRSAQRRMQRVIELLAVEPRPPGARKLVGGSGEWRVRTGNYRIIYEVDEQVITILVLALGHRKDVYRR